MSVHAIEIVTATEQQDNPDTVPTPEPPSIPSVLPDRVSDAITSNGHTEVLTDVADPASKVVADSGAGPGADHMKATHRFDSGEDLTSPAG